MREILFRGKSKSINKGEWIYGSFVEDTDLNACCIRDKSLVYELVDRETVGQFTGLCDKNGRKIFEGDIVESPNGTQGFIEWQNAECAFLVNIGDDWQTMDDCPYEVVGNIYDNKEEE